MTEVTITNFRSIRDLTLTLDREVKAQEQAQSGATQSMPALNATSVKPDEREWRVLLGENGAGKSSVVQALCLALAGKAHVEEARKLGYFDPADVLRVAPTGKRQPKQGSVTVRLTDSTITLTFSRKGFDFTAGAEGAGTFLRAYGATRLLPRGKGKRARGRRAVRIDNLFDPFTPLHNADEWIAGLWREVLGARGHADDASAALDEARSAAEASRSLAREVRDPRPALAAAEARRIATLERRLETWTKKARFAEDRFNAVALALKDLLRLDADSTVKVADDGKTVVVDDGVFQMPIRKLSDGYQTVIALAVDIMAGIPTRETDFRNTAGIVLLDELGTHLHPRWRMEIVGSLRRTFAHMQFIATTHEPLCLRGLREGEIAVMRRDDDEVTLLTDLPAPDTMRVDQLLTSRFFGLHTTIDPDVDRDFQAYYDLLARRGPVSPPDEQGKLRPDELEALKKLRKKLEPHRVLGYTRRDQLVAEVIDEYFAGERTATRAAADTMRVDAKERIAQIWRRVRSVSEAAP